MKYTKKNVSNAVKKKTIKKNRQKKKTTVFVLRSILAFFLVIFAAAMIGITIYVRSLLKTLPDISKVDISPSGFSSKVYDVNGKEVETLAASGANRVYIKLDEMPKDLQHAFVAIEDSRFYSHNGIDMKGIFRAFVTGVVSMGQRSQGASTITQQLLKNNYFTTWTNETSIKQKLDRKIQEQYLAIQLEKVTSKDTILENYLNTINLGQNTLGVQSAARRYFNKDAKDLTLSEDAVIAAITQNPSMYNPISHPKYNSVRRETVLKNMLNQKFISKAEYNEAIKDDVYSRIQNANSEISSDSATSYFTDALTDELVDDMVDRLGYTETQAYQKIYSGGLKIHSTQNTDIQNACDEAVNDPSNYSANVKYSFSYRLTLMKKNGTTKNYSDQTMISYYRKTNPDYSLNFNSQEEAQAAIDKYKSEVMEDGDTIPEQGEKVTFTLQPQVAMTIMDQKTGHVVALVGGRGDKTASKTLNRATNTTRQPGSTFKILSTYAPALDSAGLTLATVQDNAPYAYTNGKEIHNYPDSYTGYTTLREGIKNSINIVAVKTLTEIGTSLGFQYVQDFGITTLESGDNNQALAIGGITNGVKNIELTAAFATIADKGVYHKPIFYTKVTDHEGNVILDNTSTEKQEKKVVKETTAWLLTSAMQDVFNEGTATAAKFDGMHLAGKTGTTNDSKDSILVGFSPYYTCGIWGGYDDNSSQSNLSYTQKIWKQVMQKIHEGKQDKDFTMPDGIVQVNVCKESGKRPVDGLCNADPRGDMTYNEYFAEGTEPSEVDTCDKHVKVNICNASGKVANAYCPQDQITSSVKIIGEINGTAEDAYRITQDQLSDTCKVHTQLEHPVESSPPQNESSSGSNSSEKKEP
ncbi:MAG: PBP1A family penicillin-binding protein [Lachnospiraceae bacterium]|nr:PBP1A family penicillin-binding protein [Lachnospiraceae bacterium]